MSANRQGSRPLVYLVGVDALTARALCADIRPCSVRRWPLAGLAGAAARRTLAPPDVVVIDRSVADDRAVSAFARRLWGAGVPVLLVERLRPLAWLHLAGQIWELQLEPGMLQQCLAPGVAPPAPRNGRLHPSGRPLHATAPIVPPSLGGGE